MAISDVGLQLQAITSAELGLKGSWALIFTHLSVAEASQAGLKAPKTLLTEHD